jgi:hypothetical protein
MPGQTWHYQMPNWLDEGQNDKLCDDFINPNSEDYLRPSPVSSSMETLCSWM